MSPVAELLASVFSPPVWVLAGFVEWWAIWFALGSNFTATTVFTVAANGASLASAAILLGSGALGERAAEPPAHWFGWLTAGLAVFVASWALEALVLRTLMRLRRATWSWNLYDLLLFGSANASGLVVAALLTWRRLQS